MSEKAVIPYETRTSLSIGDIRTLADAFYKSGMFPDIRSMAQAIVKIQVGQELGFPPFYSMQHVYVIQGKLALAAAVFGALINRSGVYSYQIARLDDTGCELTFSKNGEKVYTSVFTIEDAKRAGLLKPDSGWLKFPKDMLFARALSAGARRVAPELLIKYTPEDLEGYVEEGHLVIAPEEGPKHTEAAPGPEGQAIAELTPPSIGSPPAQQVATETSPETLPRDTAPGGAAPSGAAPTRLYATMGQVQEWVREQGKDTSAMLAVLAKAKYTAADGTPLRSVLQIGAARPPITPAEVKALCEKEWGKKP